MVHAMLAMMSVLMTEHPHGSLRASKHALHLLPAVASKNCSQLAQSTALSPADFPLHGGVGGDGDGGDGGGSGGGGAALQLGHRRVEQSPSVQLLPPHGVTPSTSQQPPAALLQQLLAAQFVSKTPTAAVVTVMQMRRHGSSAMFMFSDVGLGNVYRRSRSRCKATRLVVIFCPIRFPASKLQYFYYIFIYIYSLKPWTSHFLTLLGPKRFVQQGELCIKCAL